MTINLIRVEPKMMIPHIKSIKKCKAYKGQGLNALIKHLESMAPLLLIQIDEQAIRACQKTNNKKIANEAEKVEAGGIKEEYQVVIGGKKNIEFEEYTSIGWQGTATDLVILNLVEVFNKKKQHALLEEKAMKVGTSLKSHKKCGNIFQVLYVKRAKNVFG